VTTLEILCSKLLIVASDSDILGSRLERRSKSSDLPRSGSTGTQPEQNLFHNHHGFTSFHIHIPLDIRSIFFSGGLENQGLAWSSISISALAFPRSRLQFSQLVESFDPPHHNWSRTSRPWTFASFSLFYPPSDPTGLVRALALVRGIT
jgi:hypothetical protein